MDNNISMNVNDIFWIRIFDHPAGPKLYVSATRVSICVFGGEISSQRRICLRVE